MLSMKLELSITISSGGFCNEVNEEFGKALCSPILPIDPIAS